MTYFSLENDLEDFSEDMLTAGRRGPFRLESARNLLRKITPITILGLQILKSVGGNKIFSKLFKTGFAKEDYDVMNVDGFIDLLLKAAKDKTKLIKLGTLFTGKNFIDYIEFLMITANTVGSIYNDYRAIRKRRNRSSFFRDAEGNLDLPKVMDSLVAYGLFGWLSYDTFGAISYARQSKTPLGRSKALNSIGKRPCALDLVKNLTDSLDDPDSSCLVERDPDSPFSCLVMILQHIAGTETANTILLMTFSLLAIYNTTIGSENGEPNYYVIYSCLANLLVDLVGMLNIYRNGVKYENLNATDEEMSSSSIEEEITSDSDRKPVEEESEEEEEEEGEEMRNLDTLEKKARTKIISQLEQRINIETYVIKAIEVTGAPAKRNLSISGYTPGAKKTQAFNKRVKNTIESCLQTEKSGLTKEGQKIKKAAKNIKKGEKTSLIPQDDLSFKSIIATGGTNEQKAELLLALLKEMYKKEKGKYKDILNNLQESKVISRKKVTRRIRL